MKPFQFRFNRAGEFYLHLGALSTQRRQRSYETHVEAGQRDQRHRQHQHRVQNVIVDDAIHFVVAQPRVRRLDVVGQPAVGRVDRNTGEVAFTEARDVVQQDECQHHEQLDFRLPYGA